MNLPDMPEAILRRIWQDQQFTTEHLTTSDGRAVVIRAAGTPNTDGGPDFLNAKISIGNVTYHGDVELHINAGEWLSHKHDADAHYNKVILHVVLTADPLAPPARTASRRNIPLLVLHPFLDEKFQIAWMNALADEQHSPPAALACRGMNDEVPTRVIVSWLERLATERIEVKLRRFEERLKQLVDETRHIVREPYPRYYGNPSEIPPPKNEYRRSDFANSALWEQLLYEGIMEGLGYSKNARPFLSLARAMRLETLRKHGLENHDVVSALLFGSAGLLPSTREIESKESRLYVLKLKTIWKSLQPGMTGGQLHEADWLFFRLRPANFPTARLAAMCSLLPKLFGAESFRRLTRDLKDESLSGKQRVAALHSLFAFQPNAFWQHHYHFKSKQKTPGVITAESNHKTGIRLGQARINDILTNTVVPIMLLYGRIFRNTAISKHTRTLLGALPASQENSVTTIIQEQLLKDKKALATAQHQQGSIQLFRYYCSQARCLECAVGRQIQDSPLQ